MQTLSLIVYNENNKKIPIRKAVPMFLWRAKSSFVGFELALKELDMIGNLSIRI